MEPLCTHRELGTYRHLSGGQDGRSLTRKSTTDQFSDTGLRGLFLKSVLWPPGPLQVRNGTKVPTTPHIFQAEHFYKKFLGTAPAFPHFEVFADI